jgi:enterochelin esterase-like enzyme
MIKQSKTALLALIVFLNVSLSCWAGVLRQGQFHSETLNREWRYLVYLPDGYEKAQKPYPVIFLLHGMYANHRHWEYNNLQLYLDNAIARKQMPPAVVLAPDGGTYSWWVDSAPYGPVETAFFNDFLPYTQNRYNISAKRSQRSIGGISMGGYAALRYSLMRPDSFGSAILFSPAIYTAIGEEVPHQNAYPMGYLGRVVWYNTTSRGVFGTPFQQQRWQELSYEKLFEIYEKQPYRVRYYMYYGNRDDICDSAMQHFLDFMKSRRHSVETVVLDGAHVWGVWRRAMPIAFNKKLFG